MGRTKIEKGDVNLMDNYPDTIECPRCGTPLTIYEDGVIECRCHAKIVSRTSPRTKEVLAAKDAEIERLTALLIHEHCCTCRHYNTTTRQRLAPPDEEACEPGFCESFKKSLHGQPAATPQPTWPRNDRLLERTWNAPRFGDTHELTGIDGRPMKPAPNADRPSDIIRANTMDVIHGEAARKLKKLDMAMKPAPNAPITHDDPGHKAIGVPGETYEPGSDKDGKAGAATVTYKDLTTVKCRDCQQICSYCYEHGEEFPDCYKKPAATLKENEKR